MSGRIRNIFINSDERSRQTLKNIGMSLFLKAANILCSFLIVPLTINYVNPTQYGIWLTISGMIAWIYFFDFGLGNGLRNKFAEAKAKGDEALATQYVATTYASIFVIVSAIFAAVLLTSNFVNWSNILKVDAIYNAELHKVFIIVSAFICLNMVVNLLGTILTADQKIGISSLIQSLGQYLSLLVIYILTKYTEGSLTNLALYFSGAPCVVMFFASVYFFVFTEYRRYTPKISNINLKLLKDIFGIGMQFFVIYMCLIAVFQLTNVVLSREIGPESVTEYNIANKYFNILYMVLIIIVSPFWSAFTDAYTKKDFAWMKSSMKKLEIVWGISVVLGIAMLSVSPFFYSVWIGEHVNVSFTLSVAVLLFTLASSLSNIYMQLINGIGTVRVQLIVYVAFAIVSWPALVYSCRLFGLMGIVVFPTIVYIAQVILSKIQLSKLMSGNAEGIWIK